MIPIDKDALILEFAEFVRRCNNDVPTWNDAVALLACAPTIDPVRHGEWKETDDPMFRACSVCGYLEWRGLWNNYCPECGARMEVENETEPIEKTNR